MKNLILIVSFMGCISFAHAQSLPDFSSIKLETETDYNANADDAALKAVTYILSTTYAKEDPQRTSAVQYMLKWMEGTPEYSFQLDAAVVKLSKDNPDLMMVMMAGMVDYVLQNKKDKDNAAIVTLAATKKLIAYVSNPKFEVKQHAELKKAIAADKKGTLKEYLAKLSE